ncbi:hypothetical protein [Porticoccus sp.]|uniref:hypothetical protein n=1 Tax=Porticoccus sp. TaxID=2024853 RepID=UPI003F6990A8
MEIKTFAELIDWTRQLHAHLAHCLNKSIDENQEERARLLLDYLSNHETEMERMVAQFEQQADQKAMQTYVYDYLSHQPIKISQPCNIPFGKLGFDDICQEVFSLHEQMIELYRTLSSKAEIPEARGLLESLLEMEEHEVMRLATQTGRMSDL